MQIFYFVFGAVTIAAAVQGALAGSIISLIAGGVLGGLILVGGYLLPSNLTVALILALIGSVGIAGKFIPTFLTKGHAIWPAGMLALLSVISIAIILSGFVRK